MSKFRFITDAKSEAYLLNIAHEMMREFGISEDEAIGRINKGFPDLETLVGEDNIF